MGTHNSSDVKAPWEMPKNKHQKWAFPLPVPLIFHGHFTKTRAADFGHL